MPATQNFVAHLGLLINAGYLSAAAFTFWAARKPPLPGALATGHIYSDACGRSCWWARSACSSCASNQQVPPLMSFFGVIHFESIVFSVGTATLYFGAGQRAQRSCEQARSPASICLPASPTAPPSCRPPRKSWRVAVTTAHRCRSSCSTSISSRPSTTATATQWATASSKNSARRWRGRDPASRRFRPHRRRGVRLSVCQRSDIEPAYRARRPHQARLCGELPHDTASIRSTPLSAAASRRAPTPRRRSPLCSNRPTRRCIAPRRRAAIASSAPASPRRTARRRTSSASPELR